MSIHNLQTHFLLSHPLFTFFSLLADLQNQLCDQTILVSFAINRIKQRALGELQTEFICQIPSALTSIRGNKASSTANPISKSNEEINL